VRHAGVLAGPGQPTRTSLFHTASADAFVMAPIDGLFEADAGLDAEVAAGDVAGQIWPMDDVSRAPVRVAFGAAGRVLCVRTMPMVRRGDYLGHTGHPITDQEFLGA
jgi:uncharacterized protein